MRVHAEIHIRPKTVVDAAFVNQYSRVDYPHFARQPQLRPKALVLPEAAIRRVSPVRSDGLTPHLVGYDYPDPETFLEALGSYNALGIKQVLILKGDNPFHTGRRMLTLDMLAAARGYCAAEGIALAVAGQQPLDQEGVKRDLAYVEEKIRAGANVVLTQPVHDLGRFAMYCRLLEASGLTQYASFRPGIPLWATPGAAWLFPSLFRGVYAAEADIRELERSAAPFQTGVELAKRKIGEVVSAGLFDGMVLFPFNDIAQTRIDELAAFAKAR